MRHHIIFNAETAITAIKYQSANSLLLCTSRDGSIYALDAANDFRLLSHFNTGLQTIDGLDVHTHDKIVALAGMGTYQVWDLDARRCLTSESFAPYNREPPGYGSGSCLRFHRSGWAIFGGYTDSFRAYNYKTGERRELFAGSDCNIHLDFHPSGDIGLASILHPQDSAEILFFDFKPSGDYTLYAEPKILFLPEDALPTDMPVFATFSPRGDRLLSTATNLNYAGTRDDVKKRGALLGVVLVHGFPDYELLQEVGIYGVLGDLTAHRGSGETLHVAQDVLSNPAALASGAYCVCGTPPGGLVLVDCERGAVVYQEAVHPSQVLSVAAVGPHQVVSGGMDGTLRLCDFTQEIEKAMGSGGLGGSVQATIAASAREFYALAVEDEDAWQPPPTTPSP